MRLHWQAFIFFFFIPPIFFLIISNHQPPLKQNPYLLPLHINDLFLINNIITQISSNPVAVFVVVDASCLIWFD